MCIKYNVNICANRSKVTAINAQFHEIYKIVIENNSIERVQKFIYLRCRPTTMPYADDFGKNLKVTEFSDIT